MGHVISLVAVVKFLYLIDKKQDIACKRNYFLHISDQLAGGEVEKQYTKISLELAEVNIYPTHNLFCSPQLD